MLTQCVCLYSLHFPFLCVYGLNTDNQQDHQPMNELFFRIEGPDVMCDWIVIVAQQQQASRVTGDGRRTTSPAVMQLRLVAPHSHSRALSPQQLQMIHKGIQTMHGMYQSQS